LLRVFDQVTISDMLSIFRESKVFCVGRGSILLRGVDGDSEFLFLSINAKKLTIKSKNY